MNNKIMKITTILIIILSLLLVVMLFSYFNKRDPGEDTKNIPNIKVSGEKQSISTKKEEDVLSGEEILFSGEKTIIEETQPGSGEAVIVNSEVKEVTEEKRPPKNIVVKPIENDNNNQKENIVVDTNIPEVVEPIESSVQESIISSSTETSNQEKQQVLDEIDNALQGLLEAVGKVPTVDEQKLDASLGSEAGNE